MFSRIARDPRLPHLMLALLLVLGALLRLRQYAVGRSLWVDEAALALNIINRSPGELLRPLAFLQGSPAGFLLLVKAAIVWGSTSEYWLRLVPLLSSLLALAVFPLVARRFLSRNATALALLILVIARPLVYYAAEVKQYSVDVLATVLGLALFLGLRSSPLTYLRGTILALAGIVLIWLSHSAVFVLGAIALVMLAVAWRGGDRRQIAALLLIDIAWAVAFLGQAALTLGDLTQNDALRDFWAGGFVPSLASGMQLPLWLWQRLNALTVFTLGLSAGVAALALAAGTMSYYRRDRVQLAVLLGPIALMFVAALLRRYPFADRLLLFTTPLVAILVAEGVEQLMGWLRPRSRLLAYAVPILLLFQPVMEAWELIWRPQYREELAPVLAHVRDNWQPGDQIYLYYGSRFPFEYYAPRFNFSAADYELGFESRNNWLPYFDKLDRLSTSGKRVWLLFSHVYTEGGANEESLFVNYLNHKGPLYSDLFRAPGAAVYLYDFR